MDYKSIYELKYNEVKDGIGVQFLNYLKKGKKKGLNYMKSYEPLIEDVEHQIKNLNDQYFESDYNSVLEEFNSSWRIYDEHNLLNTLEYETLDVYKELEHNSPIKYKDVITLMAEFNALQYSRKIIKHNFDFFDIMHQSNDFKDYSFELIEGEVLESVIFQKVYNRLYPKAKVKKCSGGPDNITLKVVEPTYNNDFVKEVSQSEKSVIDGEIDYALSKFTEDEKLLLLHILSNTKDVPLTEFLKVIRLAQLKDTSILKKCDGSNSTYRKVQNGLDHYKNKEIKREIIKGLEENIKGFDLRKIEQKLMSIKRKN